MKKINVAILGAAWTAPSKGCARCNLTANSKPGFSYHTEVNGYITVEPLPHFKVIRDLVVAGL
jgi:succinate dehydrogenase/fumarate reductase-like Fe-S protein